MLACSKKFLSDEFDSSVDTVTRATRALEASGFLWTQTRWNGAFEITWWFIREWADDRREYADHSGQNFGRRHRGVQRNTARGERGKFAANPDSLRSKLRAFLANGHGLALNSAVDAAIASTVKAGISPVHGQESALTGLTSQPGQGRTGSLVHGQESALTGLIGRPGQGAAVPGLSTLENVKEKGEEESFKR